MTQTIQAHIMKSTIHSDINLHGNQTHQIGLWKLSKWHLKQTISKFVYGHIKDYVPQIKSYVKYTQHFTKRLKSIGKLPEGSLLVILDVLSLYTNIPNHERILAVAAQLRKDRTKDPITPYILKLLELVLHSMNLS